MPKQYFFIRGERPSPQVCWCFYKRIFSPSCLSKMFPSTQHVQNTGSLMQADSRLGPGPLLSWARTVGLCFFVSLVAGRWNQKVSKKLWWVRNVKGIPTCRQMARFELLLSIGVTTACTCELSSDITAQGRRSLLYVDTHKQQPEFPKKYSPWKEF